MTLARSLGISEKAFNGWAPTTTYHYDESGRLIASTLEPEWDDAERDKILGLELYEAQLCGTCGVHPTRATEDHLYDVVPERCLVCAGLSARHRQYGLADEREEEALKARPEDERAGIRRDADGRKLLVREVSKEEAKHLIAERAKAPVPAASPAPAPENKGPRRAAEPPKEG